MPKAVRLVSTIPTPYFPSRPVTNDFDFNRFFPVALCCGIGLLVSLVAILSGVQLTSL